MQSKEVSMADMLKTAGKPKMLRERAERLRTLSTQPGDSEIDVEECMSASSGSDYEWYEPEDKRLGWPQPIRFPTEQERRSILNKMPSCISENEPDIVRSECCPLSMSDSECESSGADNDDWYEEEDFVVYQESHALDSKTPLPRSVTTRDLPDWKACIPHVPKSSSCKKKHPPMKNKPFIAAPSSVGFMSWLTQDSQHDSLISSFSSGNSSSEVWKYRDTKDTCQRSQTMFQLPEPTEFLSRLAYERLRALCSASPDDDEHDSASVAASSEDDLNDAGEDDAGRPQRTKTRSDFPEPAEYLSPMEFQRLRKSCGFSLSDASTADDAAWLSSDELSEPSDQEYLPQRAQVRFDFPLPEDYLKPAQLVKLTLEMRYPVLIHA
eukprot:TRINITY_DN54560_c0_g1_i1.p1 TRINITY_DN54560_c0_g1~~TRINITY_DN54560_c0_g1_i1.p1  ORF type:complete len:381 (-),score=68.86 TRINITY_DN54560_c0_g1_i1:187-1329(-)